MPYNFAVRVPVLASLVKNGASWQAKHIGHQLVVLFLDGNSNFLASSSFISSLESFWADLLVAATGGKNPNASYQLPSPSRPRTV